MNKLEKCKDYLVSILKSRYRDDIPEYLKEVFSETSKVKRGSMRSAQSWYRALKPADKKALEWFMKAATDKAFLHVLAMIDGSAPIDEYNEIELELFWKNNETGERFKLNGMETVRFFELYNTEDATVFTALELDSE